MTARFITKTAALALLFTPILLTPASGQPLLDRAVFEAGPTHVIPGHEYIADNSGKIWSLRAQATIPITPDISAFAGTHGYKYESETGLHTIGYGANSYIPHFEGNYRRSNFGFQYTVSRTTDTTAFIGAGLSIWNREFKRIDYTYQSYSGSESLDDLSDGAGTDPIIFLGAYNNVSERVVAAARFHYLGVDKNNRVEGSLYAWLSDGLGIKASAFHETDSQDAVFGLLLFVSN